MPLGRKHLRRNRDAPNLGWTMQRTASNLSRRRQEVNVAKGLDAGEWGGEPSVWKRGLAVRERCDIA